MTTQITTTSSIVIDIISPNVLNNTILLAIIVIIAGLLFICMVSLFFYCHKRLQAQKQQRELEIKEVLQRSLAALALKNLRSTNVPKGENQSKENEKHGHDDINDGVHTKAHSIDLQRSADEGEGITMMDMVQMKESIMMSILILR